MESLRGDRMEESRLDWKCGRQLDGAAMGVLCLWLALECWGDKAMG